MTIPARPQVLHQHGDGPCVIGGRDYSWLNCTPTSFAMAINKASLNTKRPTGCDIRRLTGDTVGGTTLSQCAYVARTHYGVTFEVHSGSNLATPAYAAKQLKAGRGFVLQGNAGALLGTKFRSTNGPVNHAAYGNDGRGWDGDIPAEVLMFDPAANHRRPNIADSPDWWPWALVLKFAAALEPNGDGTARLGPGRWYCAIGPDTEPHYHPKWGGTKSKPFPDRVRAKTAGVEVHSIPSKTADTKLRELAKGEVWTAYQYAGVWLGDHDGMEWVLRSEMAHVGGGT